jgi:hypothetical protein
VLAGSNEAAMDRAVVAALPPQRKRLAACRFYLSDSFIQVIDF